MQNLYCPKCGGIVPGLENEEFGIYSVTHRQCQEAVKKYRQNMVCYWMRLLIKELYYPAIIKYKELTGFKGHDAFHLWRKHRVSDFPVCCKGCGLYYRATKESDCPNCGILNNV